jgi:hypothetical protein
LLIITPYEAVDELRKDNLTFLFDRTHSNREKRGI